MPAQTQAEKFYQRLQKKFSRKINLDRKRINLALKKLGNTHNSIRNPINILGSDGKFSTLKSLQNLSKQAELNALFSFHPISNRSRKEFGLKTTLSVLKN